MFPLSSFSRPTLREYSPELADLFSHLNDKGMMHEDIAAQDILRAPDSTDNLVFPTHGHVHEWRIIDFDSTRKTNFSEEKLTAMSDDELEMMCNKWNPPVKTHEDPLNTCEDENWTRALIPHTQPTLMNINQNK
jgi:hypothetical protein